MHNRGRASRSGSFANLQRDLDITRQRDFLTYEWIADLLDHSEVFGVTGRTNDSVESAEFAHETFYQYFVAEGIRDRLRDGHGMALDGARFADMHMGPLVMTFLKAGFQPGDLDAVARLSVRESLSWMDRLICLYLTEECDDHPWASSPRTSYGVSKHTLTGLAQAIAQE